MEERSKLETIAEHAKDYAELRFELIKLEAAVKISNVVSSIASAVVIGLIALFTLFFVSVGVAWWIGQMNNNPSMGFFIVAGAYAVIGLILFALRNSILKMPLVNSLLATFNYDYDEATD